MPSRLVPKIFTTLILFSLLSHTDRAALYWASAVPTPVAVERGVRANAVSVCFVGDAVTSRPERVQQILTYIKEFEYVANVRFNYWGACPPPVIKQDGREFYDGDIRVVIEKTSVSGTGPVPGNFCPMFRDKEGNYNNRNDGWGSWSNPPWELQVNKGCLYNLKLGDNPRPRDGKPAGNPPSTVPYLNHTLHEFGHALGLAHEHERSDVDKSICTATRFGGDSSGGFLTPYDRYSVMHYQFLDCGINGNYDNTGLSEFDRLALHILYPEDDRTAEFIGTTLVRAGAPLNLQWSWKVKGANIDFVAKNFVWKLSGKTVSTTPDLTAIFDSSITQTLEFKYSDFLGRNYSYQGKIRVLTPAAYNQQIAAPLAARLPLL